MQPRVLNPWGQTSFIEMDLGNVDLLAQDKDPLPRKKFQYSTPSVAWAYTLTDPTVRNTGVFKTPTMTENIRDAYKDASGFWKENSDDETLFSTAVSFPYVSGFRGNRMYIPSPVWIHGKDMYVIPLELMLTHNDVENDVTEEGDIVYYDICTQGDNSLLRVFDFVTKKIGLPDDTIYQYKAALNAHSDEEEEECFDVDLNSTVDDLMSIKRVREKGALFVLTIEEIFVDITPTMFVEPMH